MAFIGMMRASAILLIIMNSLLPGTFAQVGDYLTAGPCIQDASYDPVFQYSGGQDAGMTPYLCLQNCMAQQAHQRYDKELVVGLTQGDLCLCGYDYAQKLQANLVEELVPTATFCSVQCSGDANLVCGGDF